MIEYETEDERKYTLAFRVLITTQMVLMLVNLHHIHVKKN
jgi:hypothetical protein